MNADDADKNMSEQKPKIFLTAFGTGRGTGAVNGSTPGGDVYAQALAEDGSGLGSHLSSNVDFAKHDIGLTSDWHHDTYREHYPDGYELEWIDEQDLESHDGWQKAFALNQAKRAAT
jgi:hypothetical protein